MMRSRRSGNGPVGLAATALLATVACSGLRDAVNPHVDVVARAAGQELSVQRLAELFTSSRSLPLRPDVIERAAHLWVDFLVFADRSLAGDSMLDSTRVAAAKWPDVEAMLVSRFHDRMVAERVSLDSTRVDSVYTAGDYRFIKHILWRTAPSLTAAQREAKRRGAEAARARLAAGGSWERANASNEDSTARARGGELGVVARGEMVAPFEAAAFALAPGEISSVTESPYGFHVLTRPPLDQVRDAYRVGVEERLTAAVDSTYLADLVTRRRLRVRENAPAHVREATRTPLALRESDEVLASFEGGRFLVRDFVQYLDVLPPQIEQQIGSASEDQLTGFVRSLARNQMLVAEAREAGVGPTEQDFQELRASLAAEIAGVRTALALDSVPPDSVSSPGRRGVVAAARVDRFFQTFVNDLPSLVPVPRFLADQLRREGSWRVYPAGVTRAYQLANARRQALDSAAGRAPEVPGPPGASRE